MPSAASFTSGQILFSTRAFIMNVQVRHTVDRHAGCVEVTMRQTRLSTTPPATLRLPAAREPRLV